MYDRPELVYKHDVATRTKGVQRVYTNIDEPFDGPPCRASAQQDRFEVSTENICRLVTLFLTCYSQVPSTTFQSVILGRVFRASSNQGSLAGNSRDSISLKSRAQNGILFSVSLPVTYQQISGDVAFRFPLLKA